MEESFSAALVISSLATAGLGVVVACAALVLGFVALFVFWWREVNRSLGLRRLAENPVLEPRPEHWWENEAVFNPAALVDGGRVHLFYRAMGGDGVSRIGYASSPDGVHFDERFPYPVYEPRGDFGMPGIRRRWGPLSYNTQVYASGGGWAGSEDPRAVKIDGQVYLSFTAFDGWGFIRMALTSLAEELFQKKDWDWRAPAFLSPPGEVHKNWVLFPEKIRGKYAVLHSISPAIQVELVEDLAAFDDEDTHIQSRFKQHERKGCWDTWVRGAGPPPLKTPWGWLLFYHAIDRRDPHAYKLGALLLDTNDPAVVLARSEQPVLEPVEWYENDGKPGVVYATGAVVLGENLLVYYGGGDKRIAAARANLKEFVRQLRSGEHAVLKPATV
jgi:predicted GH43/DUF377 family glycosyl hydrolase